MRETLNAMTFDELEGILEQTLENQHQRWVEEAMACITRLAQTGEPFTADDVHHAMQGTNTYTYTDNAMGAVFARARRQGIITTENQYRQSQRREAHRRMVRIWKGA